VSAGKILVVRGGAIGDFILTLPVLSALRQQFPRARLELLGYPHIAAVARNAGLVDEVRSIEARALAGFFARVGPLDQELQEYFSDFAVILSYLYDPDGFFQANVGRCSKAQFIAAPHRPNELGRIHATEVFLQPLERLAIFAPDPVPKLFPDQHNPAAGNNVILAVHPGSGSSQKNWPEEKWIEALQCLAANPRLHFLLVGGEAEEGRPERIGPHLPRDRYTLADKMPLTELAEKLRLCRLFAGHDSGITHLAAAVGVPVLALWGPTRTEIWRPLGRNISILHHEPLGALPVGDVVAALQRLISGANPP